MDKKNKKDNQKDCRKFEVSTESIVTLSIVFVILLVVCVLSFYIL